MHILFRSIFLLFLMKIILERIKFHEWFKGESSMGHRKIIFQCSTPLRRVHTEMFLERSSWFSPGREHEKRIKWILSRWQWKGANAEFNVKKVSARFFLSLRLWKIIDPWNIALLPWKYVFAKDALYFFSIHFQWDCAPLSLLPHLMQCNSITR